jgi:hypothetical protein
LGMLAGCDALEWLRADRAFTKGVLSPAPLDWCDATLLPRLRTLVLLGRQWSTDRDIGPQVVSDERRLVDMWDARAHAGVPLEHLILAAVFGNPDRPYFTDTMGIAASCWRWLNGRSGLRMRETTTIRR